MNHPLMPKATAVWLVENTALSFQQIADFCGLHALEVNAIADDEVVFGMQGMNPVSSGELTLEEIERCQSDPDARLKPAPTRTPVAKKKSARYTPVSKRQDRPDAIAWLLKNYPILSDAQISRLIGTTKPTINAVRDRSHWNTPNIKAQNPVSLGLCSTGDLEKIVSTARARAGNTRRPHNVSDTTIKTADLNTPNEKSEGETLDALFKNTSEIPPNQSDENRPGPQSKSSSETLTTEEDTNVGPY